jgi:translation initiation factor IF-3
MKVKLTLRFRGREMRHQEIGIQIVQKFIKDVAPFGTAIEQPKVVGRGMSVMVNPLPRNKRAPNPRVPEEASGTPAPKAPAPAPTVPEDGQPAPEPPAASGMEPNPSEQAGGQPGAETVN